MAYKNPKKQREYMKRWRQKNPAYMRQYYREKVKPLMKVGRAVATLEAVEV